MIDQLNRTCLAADPNEADWGRTPAIADAVSIPTAIPPTPAGAVPDAAVVAAADSTSAAYAAAADAHIHVRSAAMSTVSAAGMMTAAVAAATGVMSAAVTATVSTAVSTAATLAFGKQQFRRYGNRGCADRMRVGRNSIGQVVTSDREHQRDRECEQPIFTH
jgi:hypothetical protein